MKDLHINPLLLEHVALHISRGGQLMKLNFNCLAFVLHYSRAVTWSLSFLLPSPKTGKEKKEALILPGTNFPNIQ